MILKLIFSINSCDIHYISKYSGQGSRWGLSRGKQMTSPLHWQSDLMARFVAKQQVVIVPSKSVKIPGDKDILDAIIYYFSNLPLLPPLQGQQPISTFLGTQGLFGQTIQGKTIPQFIMDLFQQIQGGKG